MVVSSLGQVLVERVERVRPAGAGKAEAVGYVLWPDAGSALAGDQQARDGEHLGVGDHVGEHGFQPRDGGGQAVMPVLPALGQGGVPSGCQPLAGDVLGLAVGAGDVLVGDVGGAGCR
jgi:hypothetical protein